MDIDQLKHAREINIKGFPFPPTSNQLYRSFFNTLTRRMNHYKSAQMKLYEQEVERYCAVNHKQILAHRIEAMHMFSSERDLFKINLTFKILESELFTKKIVRGIRRRKKYDISNRLKAIHDSLAIILRIDDMYFCPGECNINIIEESMGESQCVDIQIKKLTI